WSRRGRWRWCGRGRGCWSRGGRRCWSWGGYCSFESPDIRAIPSRRIWNGGIVDRARETITALISSEPPARALVDSRATRQYGNGQGKATIILEAIRVEQRIERRGGCTRLIGRCCKAVAEVRVSDEIISPANEKTERRVVENRTG